MHNYGTHCRRCRLAWSTAASLKPLAGHYEEAGHFLPGVMVPLPTSVTQLNDVHGLLQEICGMGCLQVMGQCSEGSGQRSGLSYRIGSATRLEVEHVPVQRGQLALLDISDAARSRIWRC